MTCRYGIRPRSQRTRVLSAHRSRHLQRVAPIHCVSMPTRVDPTRESSVNRPAALIVHRSPVPPLGVDPFELVDVADRSVRPQSENDDLVPVCRRLGRRRYDPLRGPSRVVQAVKGPRRHRPTRGPANAIAPLLGCTLRVRPSTRRAAKYSWCRKPPAEGLSSLRRWRASIALERLVPVVASLTITNLSIPNRWKARHRLGESCDAADAASMISGSITACVWPPAWTVGRPAARTLRSQSTCVPPTCPR